MMDLGRVKFIIVLGVLTMFLSCKSQDVKLSEKIDGSFTHGEIVSDLDSK